jgi:hypothetical protein
MTLDLRSFPHETSAHQAFLGLLRYAISEPRRHESTSLFTPLEEYKVVSATKWGQRRLVLLDEARERYVGSRR